jgi:dTDP-4-amino-4,6-dideoxygalactose transaminase
MFVPLVDLRAALRPIKEELFGQLGSILDGMELHLGPNVQAFEQEFASYCQVEHGVAVSSGTDALYAALRACGIGPGDEVIAPSLTFFATIEAIIHTGAVPVLVDVDPMTLTIDSAAVGAAITPATKAILPVHLYGHPADMDAINGIAQEYRLRVIEDAAQAHGARYKGRLCGSMGHVGCFSFYFTKNLGAIGEGGFVTTSDPEIAGRIRLLRNHGHVSKSEHAVVGHNFRMDELQAAVLRLKLRYLDQANQRRREIADRYRERLPGNDLWMLGCRDDCDCIYHVFPIRSRLRDELRCHLDANAIGTGIHYKIPGHRQAALRDHPHRVVGAMQVTDAACRELLSIPMYPDLTDEQVDYVAYHVGRFFHF